MTRTVTIAPTSWADSNQDVEMGTPPEASHVEGGKYIVTPGAGIYGSGVAGHAIWLDGTPGHTELSAFNAPSPKFEVASANAGEISWSASKDACGKYLQDGGGWRVPTLTELKTMYSLNTQLAEQIKLGGDYYWAATDNGTGGGWYVHYTGGGGADVSIIANNYPHYLRCVRDIGSRLPSDYPYGGTNYIVSRDAEGTTGGLLHANWTEETPEHDLNSTNNSVSAKFEIMQSSWANVGTYAEGKAACKAYRENGGGWRMPTRKELELMFKLKAQVGVLVTSSFPNSTHHWSATKVPNNANQAYSSDNGNSFVARDLGNGGGWLATRCVRDVN